jgi:hypothetical protein
MTKPFQCEPDWGAAAVVYNINSLIAARSLAEN